MHPKQQTISLDFAKDFFIGGISATISKTITFPIIEIITRGTFDKRYKGTIDYVKRTFSYEGLLGFWKGNLTNCLWYFPTQALNFAFNETFKSMFNKNINKDGYLIWFTTNLISGSFAGLLSLAIMYSPQLARIKLTNDQKIVRKGGEKQYKGFIDVYTKIIATNGIAGLFKGFKITCVGIAIYRGIYFGVYGSVKPLLPTNLKDDIRINFVIGWSVTFLADLASYPIDTIRRRMMMTSGQPVKYSGSIDCAQQIIAKEGVLSLFKGASVQILRSIAGAGVISGYDYMKFKIDSNAKPSSE